MPERNQNRISVGQNNEIASINSKVTSLEKVVNQHTTTLDHDLVKKVAKLETEVAKKTSNDAFITQMNSANKKIHKIEQSLQNIEEKEVTKETKNRPCKLEDGLVYCPERGYINRGRGRGNRRGWGRGNYT